MLAPPEHATCFRHATQRAEITCSRGGTLFPRRFWARLGLLGAAIQSEHFATSGLPWLSTLAVFVAQGRRTVMLFSALLAAAAVDRVTRRFALSEN
jgi:hypothetical protein